MGEHRLQGVDSIVTCIMQVEVIDLQINQDTTQALWVGKPLAMLLQALVVHDLGQPRQVVDIDIDRQNQVDILGNIMANDHDFAIFARGLLWSHDLQAYAFDIRKTDEFRFTVCVISKENAASKISSRNSPKLEELGASLDKFSVLVASVFFDTKVTTLNIGKPVSSILTRSNMSNIACIQGGVADLCHKLGNSLKCFDVEADEYDIVLTNEGDGRL